MRADITCGSAVKYVLFRCEIQLNDSSDHNNGNRTSGVLHSYNPWRRPYYDHVRLKTDKLSSETCEAFDVTFSVPRLDVLFLHVSVFA